LLTALLEQQLQRGMCLDRSRPLPDASRVRFPTSADVRPDQRYAWCGQSLLITTVRGECDESDSLTGYYFREARHLRTLRLFVNGRQPWICSGATHGHRGMSAVFVYPELTSFGGGGTDVADDTTWSDEFGIAQRSIDIRAEQVVEPHRLTVTVSIGNRSSHAAQLEVAWELAADFADIQEAFSGKRQQSAPIEIDSERNGATMRYCHETLDLATHVSVVSAASDDGAHPGWMWTNDRLRSQISVAPQQSLSLTLVVQPHDPDGGIDDDAAAARLAAVERWRDHLPTVETVHDTRVAEIVNQAGEDLASLALLHGPRDEWLAVQAGIPLYPALFGRDAFTCGWQAAMLDDGAQLDAALTRLGRLQSDRVFDWRDEEPGRIPYQVRSGPLARLDLNPYAAYYADFASPLMFIISLAHRFAWSGDKEYLRRHWDVARRILDWAREYGDADGDGYLEYETKSSQGTKNQGWKDSGNAILYADGRPVPAPLGTCDLQGYWFAAQQLMSVLSWVMEERADAKAHWHAAMQLKERFNRDWWLDDEGFVALALDAGKQTVRSVTSNVGQCLATGIISEEHMPQVVGRLFAPDLFSGWGIRTLSTKHPAYNPLAYHLGTVWPVENATIVFGLRRFGFDARALDLATAMFDLAQMYPRGRVPECVGGYARHECSQPGAYPRANPIQAWNQSAFAMVLQTILGLQPVAVMQLLIVDPVLPAWLPEVTVRGLRVGEATATVRFVRDESGKSHAGIIERHGTLHLLHQPPPESVSASARDRLGALVESMMHH
jgi:glycogen debranching enzyme